MHPHKTILAVIVIVSMWLSVGCGKESKPEPKHLCYTGQMIFGNWVVEDCATAEEAHASLERLHASLLDYRYLPDQSLDGRRLVKFDIPTRGNVVSIKFLQDRKYRIEHKNGEIVVTGPVEYMIADGYENVCPRENVPYDSPCRAAKTMHGQAVRTGTLTLR